MKNSKFDALYDNIILEQYHHNFGFWNAKKCGEKIGNMLDKRLRGGLFKSGLLDDLNDTFVPKKWFDFSKKLSKSKEGGLDIVNYSVNTCKIQIRFTVDLTEKDAELLIYGEKKDGKYLPLLEKRKKTWRTIF